MSITITDKAATKVHDYLKQVEDQSLNLRVFVKAGGGAGYQFGLKLDKTKGEDLIQEIKGAKKDADTKTERESQHSSSRCCKDQRRFPDPPQTSGWSDNRLP